MTELIQDICEPSDLIVPQATTGKDQAGSLIVSGAKLWVNVDGSGGWEEVTSS
jgi:hypothetical protein